MLFDNIENKIKNGLDKGLEKTKMFAMKIGNGVLPAMLITSIMFGGMNLNAMGLDNHKMPNFERDLRVNVVQGENNLPKININSVTIEQNNSLESIQSHIDKSLSVDSVFTSMGLDQREILKKGGEYVEPGFGVRNPGFNYTQEGEVRGDIYQNLEKLSKHLGNTFKMNISQEYRKGNMETVNSMMESLPNRGLRKIHSIIKRSLNTGEVSKLVELNKNLEKEIKYMSYENNKNLNNLVDKELKGERTGLSSTQISELMSSEYDNYQKVGWVHGREENNKEVGVRMNQLEQVKSKIEQRSQVNISNELSL